MKHQKIETLEFAGFTPETYDFLVNVREQNSKTWYEEHKSAYQQFVVKPMQGIVAELTETMLAIDPLFEVTPAVGKTISRIYRDTRFSHDKSLYRDNVWLTFKRPSKNWLEAPSFYFEIFPTFYRYGMGFYTATRQTMDRFREMLEEDPEHFLQVVAFYPSGLFTLEGEAYKKLLKKNLPVGIQEWYQKKTFYLASNRLNDERLASSELLADLREGFQMLAPLYHFLWEAKTSADSRAQGLKNNAIFQPL